MATKNFLVAIIHSTHHYIFFKTIYAATDGWNKFTNIMELPQHQLRRLQPM